MSSREQPRIHRTYKCVDLFSGAGGSALGYWISGFDVTGIDFQPQRNYPYPFVQMDAIEYLNILISEGPLSEKIPKELQFLPEFIHASPPCQLYSAINSFPSKNNRVDLLDITRDLLLELQFGYSSVENPEQETEARIPELTWVIENVAGSPLVDPVQMCGATFGLKTYRHRFFEFSHPEIRDDILEHMPPHTPHIRPQAGLGRRPLPHEFMQVVGGLGDVMAARLALGIPWMSGPELAQAIPPAYTAYIGAFMRRHLDAANKGKPLFA